MILTATFIDSPLMTAVWNAAGRQSSYGYQRQMILIQMLSKFEQDHSFKDAKELSHALNANLNQCERVWDVCLARNVLRPRYDGFSARDWMTENGMLTDVCSNAQILHTTRVQGCEVDNHAHENEKAQGGAKLSQQSPSTASTPSQGARAAFFGNKKAVRPNVFLSDREMNTLRSQFTAEQIERMLDTLSDYKMAKNRDYASDYNAITRWVVKTLEEKQVQTNTATYTPPRAYREITPEEDFKTSHGGMTRQEWDDYQRWANSEEGKKEIEQKKALLRAAVGL